jgi:hypothetical protein
MSAAAGKSSRLTRQQVDNALGVVERGHAGVGDPVRVWCIDRGFTLYSRRSVRGLVATALYDRNAVASNVRGQGKIVRV